MAYQKKGHQKMKPDINDKLLDELLKNYNGPEDLLGPEGLLPSSRSA